MYKLMEVPPRPVAAVYDKNEIFRAPVWSPCNFKNIGVGNFKRNIKSIVLKPIWDIDVEKN